MSALIGVTPQRQIDLLCIHATTLKTSANPRVTADPRAFSLTTRITQRDARTEWARSRQPRPPTSPGELNRGRLALP